jgi:hypothetical protein
MARKITKLGHTVKGALAAFIAPRLASDAAFKVGELDKLLKDVKPAPFKQQIKPITDSVKALFKDRLAKDADVEDLAELLEALGSGDEDDDDEAGEDAARPKKDDVAEDDVAEDDDSAGEKLMQMLSHYDIPASDLEAINSLITELSKPAARDAVLPKKGAPVAKPVAAASEKDDNAAPMKDVPVTKPAMDAAIRTATDAAIKETKAHMSALYEASNDVRPFVGEINTLAFDSADAIFKFALDAHQIETKGVHPSAYKSLLPLIHAKAQPSQNMATDSADVVDFEKRYTHIPARA